MKNTLCSNCGETWELNLDGYPEKAKKHLVLSICPKCEPYTENFRYWQYYRDGELSTIKEKEMKNKIRIRIINAGKITFFVIMLIAVLTLLSWINEILPAIAFFHYFIYMEIFKIRELLEKRNEI